MILYLLNSNIHIVCRVWNMRESWYKLCKSVVGVVVVERLTIEQQSQIL
jgi:hypothetical protein